MSVFRVKLQQLPEQGYMDLNPATASSASPACPSCLGSAFTTSIQRTMYCAGPRRIWRKLADGATFVDCNYWKRFSYPTVSKEVAFIEVVTDDGSIYSDSSEENTFPVIFGGDTAYDVLTTDTFEDNYIDILTDYGGFAKFVQITNNGTADNQTIKVQLNGSSSAIMTLADATTQVFNAGDLAISKLGFEGGTANTTVQIILSVEVQCNS